MNKVSLTVAVTIALLLSGRVHVRAQPLSERDVHERAVAGRPSLRAALLEVERARLSVEGEEARYVPSLIVDAGVTRTETPSLTRVGTRVSAGTTAEAGVAA